MAMSKAVCTLALDLAAIGQLSPGPDAASIGRRTKINYPIMDPLGDIWPPWDFGGGSPDSVAVLVKWNIDINETRWVRAEYQRLSV